MISHVILIYGAVYNVNLWTHPSSFYMALLGRQEIVNDFRALVSSFPEEMGAMQSELSKYKEAALNIHSLRADVQCFSRALDRMVVIIFALFLNSV